MYRFFSKSDCSVKSSLLSFSVLFFCQTQIRKFRTLTELIVDAQDYIKNPYKGKKIKVNSRQHSHDLWPTSCVSGVQGLSNSVPLSLPQMQKHPDFPKKPLTPYFRFFMEKRAKYAKLHPEMSNLDLTKILSKKYRELPDKKKVSQRRTPRQYMFFFPKKYPWKNNVSFHNYRKNMLTTSYEIRKHLFKV